MRTLPQQSFGTRQVLPCPVPRARVVPRVSTVERTPQQAGTHEAANQLEALKMMSKVVADSGEIEQIRYCRHVYLLYFIRGTKGC